MPKVAVLGITGMLGSTVFDVLKKADFNVIGISRRDIDAETATIDDIKNALKSCEYSINCIGIIKPYIHDDNASEVERAIIVNALFPHKLAQCGIKVIQIATDCVFDGLTGNYVETDKHNALDVYGKSKSLGEVTSENFMNLRCSVIGLEKKNKSSLLEWFLNQSKNSEVNGFKNHYWNGITTIAFAKICKGIIENNFWFNGLQHIIPSNTINKADMLKNFADIFKRKDINITDINALESIDRTIKTINKSKNKTLWQMAGYTTVPSIENLIAEIKNYE
jgi:dTDP-4-dehydrorhamnose reductase